MRWTVPFLAAGLGLLTLGAFASTPGTPSWRPPPGQIKFSLLVAGDTGKRPSWITLFETLPNVVAGLEAVDGERPVDALVLLGDNFYPKGLRRSELVPRVAGNVADPFCRFADIAPDAPLAIQRACPRARRVRAVPIIALLGNHDYGCPESPELQRHSVSLYVPNWRVPLDTVEHVELAAGVSLVLVDSTALEKGDDPAALTRVLAETPGPWRILALHKPLRDDRGSALVRRAIDEAGRPVHMLLAGHEHSLQLRDPGAPGPVLEVVSGGGSNSDPIPPGGPPRRAAIQRPGFARIDLVEANGASRLQVTLFAVARRQILSWRPPEVVAAASVGLAGDVRDESL